MADLDALVLQVQRTVGDERSARFSTDLIKEFLNAGLKELALITRNYNVVDTAFAVTAPGPTDLPDDFISLNRVLCNDNPLWKLDYRQVKAYKDTTSPSPSFYYIKNNQIQLYPSPSVNLTLELDYTAVPDLLVAGSDTLDPSLGHHRDEFVRLWASRELSIIGQDFEAAQHFMGQIGLLEMKTREEINSTDSYENLQIYPAAHMSRDDVGHGWLT